MEILLAIGGLIALAVVGYFLFRLFVGIFSFIVIAIAGILGVALVIYIIGEIIGGLFVTVQPIIPLLC